MNFREVAAIILTAFVIAVALSAAMAPQAEEHISIIAKRDVKHRFAP
jgi:multisubunit Na+/H+ antiporter MnhC subunit